MTTWGPFDIKKGKQPSRLKTILILRKVRKKVNNS